MRSEDVPERTYYRTPATAPGPSGPQMLREVGEVARRPLDYLLQTRRHYGSLLQFPIPSPPVFLADGPHLVREVLQAQTRLFDKDTIQYRSLAAVTGEGLLAATEPVWRQQRPVVQPAFHTSVTERLVADVNAAADRLIRRWSAAPDGSVVDVDDAMMRLGMEVVGDHLFGADLADAAPRLTRATLDALAAVVASARPPWSFLGDLRTPVRRRYLAAMAELHEATADVVNARVRDGDPDSGPDLLSLLLATYPPTDVEPLPVVVRDQLITFLVAGHETVASALTWAIGLLARHPEHWRRIREEAASVTDPGHLRAADLAGLIHTRAVVDEALRLFPPAWIITRSPLRDTVLAHRRIPAGSLVIISPWVLHRDPDLWPEPDAFIPDRFTGPTAGSVSRRATAHGHYLPFGTGLRLCIGRDMAVIEAVVTLARLATAFDVTAQGPLPRPKAMVTLRPADGMPVELRHRRSAGEVGAGL